MTLQELINWFDLNSKIIITYYAVIFICSFLGLLLFKNKSNNKVVQYFYSLLVHAVSIPGMFSLVLTLYSFFMLKRNLLALNLLVYVLPIIASIIVLVIINKTIKMKDIPGFGRLSGLLTLIVIVGFLTYILQKMFFGVMIVGSFKTLIILFLVVY